MPITLRQIVASRRIAAVGVVVGLLLAGGCASTPKSPGPKEKAAPAPAATVDEQIAVLLDHLQDDISHRRLPRVLSVISDAYKDDSGRDFNAVKQFLTDAFRDNREIHVTRTPPKLTVQTGEVRAIETLGVIGEPESGKVPPFNFQGNVTITLRQVQQSWLITKVQVLQ